MRQLFATVALVAGLAAALAGCRGESPAVARLSVEPHALALGFPELRSVRFNWQPTAALGEGAAPVVFVHLLDAKGKVQRTFDHPFPGPWQEGVPASYEVKLYQSALAAPLAAGRYRLTAGLYGAHGMRWPLAAGPRVARDEYQVAEVDVPAAAAGPRFSYSGTWLPSEPVADRQVVTRRWLLGEGAIEVAGLPGPGSLWVVLSIPEGKEAGEQIIFDAGANTPSVMITGTCGGAETGFSGSGRKEIEIAADGAHGSCTLRLKPNFTVLVHGRPRRSVALDALSWAPAAPAAASPR
ncbi:MAG TPA: hypothetical protein VIH93_08785 [Thermoanaerobaculia bacterium]|jgi:hypothetical protein